MNYFQTGKVNQNLGKTIATFPAKGRYFYLDTKTMEEETKIGDENEKGEESDDEENENLGVSFADDRLLRTDEEKEETPDEKKEEEVFGDDEEDEQDEMVEGVV